MTKKFANKIFLFGLGVAFTSAALAHHNYFRSTNHAAQLDGFQEVPSVLTEGSGMFKARLGKDKLYFTFKYNNVAGPIKFAHIHFAQPGANGGVLAFLCTNDGSNAPANVPSCPGEGEKLQGMISGDGVLEIAEQGVVAGDFEALKKAIKNGAAYINVHTDAFPSGELRGNIQGQSGSEKNKKYDQRNSQPDDSDSDHKPHKRYDHHSTRAENTNNYRKEYY
ncbi:CHRD domain-containing protein [Photobacterium atrarenae]|uniref:CHRD domain-containing protein n=1 Tax=Photobacterium atrarenae TaxID=865757 RepID=A0ABY5GJQ3_9GAMM|nr:CHRD domain-containing protein [Photobacterium atrarenae]UTV29021.1 CHRD domain-containing protein [Photobacterium atrarenae]